ncbi:MAG: sigma-70 family RNA polymerase sigma factor [Deltaproteobacteria bacterium]|nr:sigma-70 family RNA polymerase sigma factor [Deltaproteobacteria bacterium]MBN2671224.1 sigma-70 family RNA polymerase sigma factor [Deltaproteobacteria bacterium]
MNENCAKQTDSTAASKAIVDMCRLAAEGNVEAARKLAEMVFNRIHKTASYLASNLSDAEDLAQAACVEVLCSAGSFRGESSLHYWADRVTIQTAAKLLTTTTRRRKIWDRYHQPERTVTGSDKLTDRAAARHRLAALLSTLKLPQREMLLLCYVHGYTTQEAADVCGIPFETARGRLKKGRSKLKRKVVKDPLLSEWIRDWSI